MEPVHGAMHRGRGRILQPGASSRTAGWRLLILAGLTALPFSIASARGLVADDLYRLQEISDPQFSPDGQWIAYTVATSLVGVVMFGTFCGSMLPFLLRRLGLDPAAASAPFVATLVDVTGLVIYFVIAGYVLRGTLL